MFNNGHQTVVQIVTYIAVYLLSCSGTIWLTYKWWAMRI